MPIDPFYQVVLVGITAILALIVSYSYFKMNFNYFLYFELIFLTLFISLNIIEFYYISVVILVIAILIYQAVEPRLRSSEDKK